MSEYGDYNQRMFQQSERNSFRAQAQYSAEYIDFNSNFNFTMCRTENPQYQTEQIKEKINNVDTDCTIRPKQDQKAQEKEERNHNIIETSFKAKYSYLRIKRGSAKETMQLNINFKTIFCKLIRELATLKLLRKGEKELFMKYRNESPSFKSLTNFLDSDQNRQSKQKLKQLLSSSLIVVKIQQSDLKMETKITMFKFLQVMRVTVVKGNETQKWKKIMS